MNDEEMNEMAQAAAALAQVAHDNNAGALILYPYDGPPPPASFFLEMMQEMIEETGEAMGSLCIGTGGESGTLPLTDIHPVDALQAVLQGRLAGVIPKVDWITLCCDTYVVRDIKGPDVRLGAAAEAFQAGDPNATEALMAMCVAPDGPGYDVHQCYVRTPDGVEWEEPHDVDPDSSVGDIPFLMQQIVLA